MKVAPKASKEKVEKHKKDSNRLSDLGLDAITLAFIVSLLSFSWPFIYIGISAGLLVLGISALLFSERENNKYLKLKRTNENVESKAEELVKAPLYNKYPVYRKTTFFADVSKKTREDIKNERTR